jgi:hypothetical protein
MIEDIEDFRSECSEWSEWIVGEKRNTPRRFISIGNIKLEYTEDSVILVQTGRGRGAYRTRNRFVKRSDGLFPVYTALMSYRAINIGNGYKKRLIVDGKCVAREMSE